MSADRSGLRNMVEQPPQTERHRFADLHSRIDRAFAGLPGA
jgi:hypothetical protein